MPALTPELAERFAKIALGHVTREYPHKADHVMDSAADVYTPRALHPLFYGSYDWHSCVHSYWLLARLRRLEPNLPQAEAIEDLFDSHLTPEKVRAEGAYLARISAAAFERPYGWAWLLMLAAELRLDQSHAPSRWCAILRPLSDALVERFHKYLSRLTYPIRAGVHTNTAFALALAGEYASVFEDRDFAALLAARAEAWFGSDSDAPAWEPSGDDFLSPTLIEAEAMRRLIPAGRFADWFNVFLPSIRQCKPSQLFTPALVSDRRDGKIGHLDGLNLSRAWCWSSLAAALSEDDERRPAMLQTAELHYNAVIDCLTYDYLGEHWLPTFALLALTANRSHLSAERLVD